MSERILSITVVLLTILFFSLTAAAQVVITGPGIPPEPPLRLIVNPPSGAVSVIYTFRNTNSTPINVMPILSCPPNTVSFEIDSTPFTLAAGESKQVAAFFADLPGEAEAGATVSCMINSTVIIINIIAPPPTRSLLKTDISLRPQTTSQEKVPFDIDFEMNLDLNLDINGFLIRSDTGLGVTGTEFQIFELQFTIGQVSFSDQFVFATPFNMNGEAIGPLLFVKKRVATTLTINGLTIENLAIFEDVNFPDPDTSALTSYEAADQFFAFGDILRVSGLTPGGVSFAFITGINADPQKTNKIKKRFFPGKVEKNEKLGFTVEKIRIEGLILGGLIFGSETEFRPNAPFRQTLTMRFGLADLATVTAVATLTDILAPQFLGASVVIATPDIILITTLDANLNVTSQNVIATFSLNSTIASTLFLTFVPGTGLTVLNANLVISLGEGDRFTNTISFSGTPPRFQSTQFTLDTKVGNIELTATACFSASGLGGGTCGLPALITAKIRF